MSNFGSAKAFKNFQNNRLHFHYKCPHETNFKTQCEKGGFYYDLVVVTVTTVLTGVTEEGCVEVAGVLLEAWLAELTAAPLSAPLTALMTEVATEVAAVLRGHSYIT